MYTRLEWLDVVPYILLIKLPKYNSEPPKFVCLVFTKLTINKLSRSF